jgi:cytochrome P450
MYFNRITEKFKDGIFLIWAGPRAVVMVYEAEKVEAVLSSTHVISKSQEYVFVQPWLGTGLLTSTGSKWHSRRKLLTPAFHFRILKDYISIMNREADILVRKLEKHATDGAKFDMLPYITLCTLDTISSSAMGVQINAQQNENPEYVKAITSLLGIIQTRHLSLLYRNDFIFNLSPSGREQARCLEILHGFTMKVIKERKLEMARNGSNGLIQDGEDEKTKTKARSDKKRLAFLDLLISASDGGRVLSDEDIREEVDTFLFAGHDTTAVAVAWVLYSLGRHPDIQKKVQEELYSIFGSSNRDVTNADLMDMKYLECVIKETLRICPSVPLIARDSGEGIQIGEYFIPPGVSIGIPTACLHRDSRYFPEPRDFNPDHFLPENNNKRHPFAYVPFSAGPRNCIGKKFAQMEEKVILSWILRKYSVTALDNIDTIRPTAEIILKPSNGLQVRLEKIVRGSFSS